MFSLEIFSVHSNIVTLIYLHKILYLHIHLLLVNFNGLIVASINDRFHWKSYKIYHMFFRISARLIIPGSYSLILYKNLQLSQFCRMYENVCLVNYLKILLADDLCLPSAISQGYFCFFFVNE